MNFVLRLVIFSLLLACYGHSIAQSKQLQILGVYQGRTLFIQNPFDPKSKQFCVESIMLNNQPIAINLNSSALKLDFNGIEVYAPVHITIVHLESCKPIVINPDAINFHSIFSFSKIAFQDSVIAWSTMGEKPDFRYTIEKYQLGIWDELDEVPAKALFGGASYTYQPLLDIGANKLRVKCIMEDGAYLYSFEVDFHFYPEPVTFTPLETAGSLKFSRTANFEIYDAGGDLVHSGQGSATDVEHLPSGDYVIYFDEKDPGVFKRK
jgi:hypothetical protein